MPDQTPPTIRRLHAGDLVDFRALLGVLGEAFEEPETYTAAQPSDAYITELLAGDAFIAVAAFDGGAVIGGLTAYELKKFEQERSEVYIYDLAVAGPYRRRGVATGLINHLKTIAKDRGAYVIIIQADDGDEPATNLYTKLGVREDVLHFDIAVD